MFRAVLSVNVAQIHAFYSCNVYTSRLALINPPNCLIIYCNCFNIVRYLLIRQPPRQLRGALLARLICYLPYIFLAQRWCIGSCDLDPLRGLGVSVVGF